ncbi:hypothetical protein [Marinicella sp. W31]|uniref:hypothetical protein n=1 Tax=Marinicella sp. W31 TaxID=3023713 RepID=UPI003756E01D
MRIRPESSRKIFNNPNPPKEIWQKQFDDFDQQLKKLARSNWKEIEDKDLWYYFHDLAYVELQPDLFNYLFPVCLNFWYQSLIANESASRGGLDLHQALIRGQIFEKMTTSKQTEAIFKFFHDGFIDRIEMERGFQYYGSSTPAYFWISRFNSLGITAPIIDRIWSSWWNFNHPGKAVSAVMYASGLVYLGGENPIFGEWTRRGGGGGPYLTESDFDLDDTGWIQHNVSFLKETLSVKYIQEKLKIAADRLQREPEAKIAKKVAKDALAKSDIIEIRIDDLINGLSRGFDEFEWQ